MYKIALTQVIFDNSYNNVLRFSSLDEQKAYFHLDTLFSKSPDVNLPFGTFYMTRVPIRIDDSLQNEALSYNYAVVKDLEQDDVYYYYFVKNASYDAGNTQMLCDLELDIFNTYYIGAQFTPCLINRAHIDRWGNVENGKVKFNNSLTSNIFAQEELQPTAKYLAKREEIDFIDVLSDNEVKRIIKSKVKGWAYMFLDANIINDETIDIWVYKASVRRFKTEDMPQNYLTLVFPICDNDVFKVSNVASQNTYNSWYFGCMGEGQLGQPQNFIINKFAPYILDIVVSQEPPLALFTDDNFSITTSGDTIQLQCLSSSYDDYKNDYFASCSYLNTGNWLVGNNLFAIINCQKYKLDYRNIMVKQLPYVFEFAVDDIVSSVHNEKYNPKLLSQPYTDLRLGYANAQPQNYDAFKLGQLFKLKWYNNIEPSILKSYIGLYNDSNDIYNENTFKSYLGCKLNIDASLPYSIDQLKSFLAQNKNFYQIAKNTYSTSMSSALLKGVAGSMSAMGLTRLGGSAIAKVIPATSIVSMLTDMLHAQTQYDNAMLTLDNMDNAPETFKNLDNAIFVNLNINETKPYIEYWECVPYDKKISDNYMNKNGYTYNMIDNVKNVDNIRHYWNYVQAQIENIYSSKIISNNVREKFKEVFARGVRFWNITDLVINNTFDYNLHENYERRLKNEL